MTTYTMYIITVWCAHTDVEKLHTVHVDKVVAHIPLLYLSFATLQRM